MKLDSIKSFLRDEDGAAAVEYAILIALVGVTVIAALTNYDLKTIFTEASKKATDIIKNASTGGPAVTPPAGG